MKDDLNIARTIKNMNKIIYNLVEYFPKKEKVLRDRLLDTSFRLLEDTYKANYTEANTGNRIDIHNQILTDIRMINYYLDLAFSKNYIGDSDTKKLGKYLLAVSKMAMSWKVSVE